jgi:hypothetical protein
MWKASLPPILDKYLFAQIRPASSASEESCSYSLETRCTHKGNSSTPAFLRPKSKILIYEVRRNSRCRFLPLDREHHGCIEILDMVCSCLEQISSCFRRREVVGTITIATSWTTSHYGEGDG